MISLIIRLIFLRFNSHIRFIEGLYYSLAGRNFATGNGISDFDRKVHIVVQPLYPVFIGLVTLITRHSIVVERIVPAITGSLLIIPCFLLTKKIYTEKTAYITSVLICIHYLLIESSTAVSDNMIFSLFLLSSLLLMYYIINNEHKRYYHFLFGLLLGLSYLTKSIGLLYIGLALIFYIFRAIKKYKNDKKTILDLLYYAFGSGICICLYMIYARKCTGYYFLIPHYKFGNIYDINSGLLYIQVNDYTNYFKTNLIFIIKRTLSNIDYIMRKDLIKAASPIIIILLAASFFYDKWQKNRIKNELMLIIVLSLYILTYAIIGNVKNMYFAILPIMLIWTSNGISNIHDWFKRSIRISKNNRFSILYKNKIIFPSMLVIFIQLTTFQGWYRTIRDHEYSDENSEISLFEANVGLQLQDIIGENKKMLASKEAIPFYANGIFIPIDGQYAVQIRKENITSEKLIKLIKETKAKYLIVDKHFGHYFPELQKLYNGKDVPEELKLLKIFEDKNEKVLFYEIYD